MFKFHREGSGQAFSSDSERDDVEEFDDDEHDLDNGGLEDYKAVPALDSYDDSMLDQGEARPLSSRARRLAEAEMRARDARERLGILPGQSSKMIGSRGPKAMDQVQANLDGNKEVSWLAKRIKAAPAVVSKATELMRKAYTGVRCLSSSEKLCLPATCLEIAGKLVKRPLEREKLLEEAGHKKQEYMRVLTAVYCMLKIKREVSVSELCQDFKCNPVQAEARRLLENFKTQFWASLPEERRQYADFSRPVFAACALFITADKHKAIVKAPTKMDLMKVDSEYLDACLMSMHLNICV
jgi:hypothetical protein